MNPNSLAFNIALCALTLAASLIVVVLKKNGVIDGDIAERALGVIIGLILVIYANFIPKQISRNHPQGRRFVGWTFTLAYLAYAAIWAFAPSAYTFAGSLAAVGSALVITIAYCTWKRTKTA